MSDWKHAYRSFYYETAEDPDDIRLTPEHTGQFFDWAGERVEW